ncbi:pyrimidine/purine nucleoside phosphorylase [Ectothiorhodospiraceae bacterium 2226]|nr:pyrimidine/purine nucleoside phosphorylase [Ectothiorhodospiraceae bacterium 2226]
MFKINEYFDSKVVSIAFQTERLPATVGVMAPGAYEFGTDAPETVQVVSGALTIRQPGESEWRTYREGERFQVPGKAKFGVQVEVETAYLCLYG